MESDTPASFSKSLSPLICQWFVANQRNLPWRENYDPYEVMVSEFMAQQTVMKTVVPYFIRWMEAFPNIQHLAKAHEETALKLWEGLGYYSRCRNLLRTAKIICDEFNGQIPHDPKILESLPGIGPYTASAIASIAYGEKIPVVDGNVKRVVSRLFEWGERMDSKKTEAYIKNVCGHMLQVADARTLNQGLMELGSICHAGNPKCDMCPLSDDCGAKRNNTIHQYPVKKVREKSIRLNFEYQLIISPKQVVLAKIEGEFWWEGMWIFPFYSDSYPDKTPQLDIDKILTTLINSTSNLPVVEKFDHAITKYRITATAKAALVSKSFQLPSQFQWVDLNKLNSLPMPKASANWRRYLLEKYTELKK